MFDSSAINTRMKYILLAVFIYLPVHGLDNGLAKTPPMGWLSWERIRCFTNRCDEMPGDEQLFKDMADLIVSEGYLHAGYEYFIIKDSWLEKERDKDGRLQADAVRFPNGMKSLADYIHGKGLKFGIYQDYGITTCAGFPRPPGFEAIDAQTFANWDVDYLKFHGCFIDPKVQENGTAEFSRQLNATGRPILLSCDYPFFEYIVGIKTNYTRAAEICNLWRNYGDIRDSWETVIGTLDYYKNHQNEFQPHAGPGHWNDPDMVFVDKYGRSKAQSEAQMALWSILASPLLMSTDLQPISAENKAILLNKAAIAINQDKLGIQGRFIKELDKIDLYTKPIEPIRDGNHSYVIGFLSRRNDSNPMFRSVVLKDIGLNNPNGYEIQDVFVAGKKTVLKPDQELQVRVKPTGVVFLQATAL